MVKHTRKKQRTLKDPDHNREALQPLGSVDILDDASKDDEERRLENMLFGTTHDNLDDTEKNVLVVSDDDDLPNVSTHQELQNLSDTDLFFVDDAQGVDQVRDDPDASTVDGLDTANNDQERDSEDSDADEPPKKDDRIVSSTALKSAAWTDPDDPTLQVSLASNKRRRKLRDAVVEDVVGGREYERRLRRQFEKINPAPEWASNARNKLHPQEKTKRRRPSTSSASTSDEDVTLPDLLAGTNSTIQRSRRSAQLPQGTLSIERLRDANQSAKSEGEIKTVQFHPSPQVPVLLTASADRRVRLFSIDGHTNSHLQTVHIPALPLTTALFHPSGTSVLLTGTRPFFYVHDLQSGNTLRSPRGLWGTTFTNSNPAAQDASMEICAFDPSGEVLAVAGRRGHVHLVDWRGGQGQVVGSVKMNAGVKSLWWTGGSRTELMSLGEDSEVYVWDVGERRCVNRWKDNGGFGSRILAGDKTGQYVAIGARTGLVNVYGSGSHSTSMALSPKSLKTIDNLTTAITSLRFNHDSQLLAVASNTKKDQMRMIHLPSLTAFSNWPTSSTPLGHVTSIDFSTGSEYVAVGNNRGRVLLYHLRDYAAQ